MAGPPLPGRLEETKALLQGSEAEAQVDRMIAWAHNRLDEIETSPQSARKNKDGYFHLSSFLARLDVAHQAGQIIGEIEK
jgi:hypothetical protein